MLSLQRTHCYADVDEPNISYLARKQSNTHDGSTCIQQPVWPGATISSSPLLARSAECSSDILACASSHVLEQELQSSGSWNDAPEPILFGDCHNEQKSTVFPKKYVPFSHLLDDSKKMGAAEQATPLCTSWITFSAGTQADSILILNSSLSVAVQFFSDCSSAPRLRTIVPSKPLHYTISETGVLAEFQSSATLPIWSGDPRFSDSNQRVVFASWFFWREHSPVSSSISIQSKPPIFCTACSSLAGKAFRFHFLSNGELIVIGTASGFVCRGSNIIADRVVALSAFQKFKTCIDSAAVSILPSTFDDSSLDPKLNIYSLCQMVASSENLPAKSAWKSGENLYDRLMISKWAPNTNELVTRAALDVSASVTLFDLPENAKRQKGSNFEAHNGLLPDQSWEEFQESESQRERDDRMYAQRLHDEEIAAARLSALRSRRGDKNLFVDHRARSPSFNESEGMARAQRLQEVESHSASASARTGIVRSRSANVVLHDDHETRSPESGNNGHDQPIKATLTSQIDGGSSALLSSMTHSDMISDSDASDDSNSSSSVDASRLPSAVAGHKIRFVFKNNQNELSYPHHDSPSISEMTSLRSHIFFEVPLTIFINTCTSYIQVYINPYI